MADVYQYNPTDSVVANRVVAIHRSAHTPSWDGVENVLINPEAPKCLMKYMKKYGTKVIEMNAFDKGKVD